MTACGFPQVPNTPPETILWTCDLGSDQDIDLATARVLMSDAEGERAKAFRFRWDRERYIRARGFVRTCLADVLGLSPTDLAFETVGRGKPILVDAKGIEFNLSHSGELAVLAVTRGRRVGIDVELPNAGFDPLDLGRSVFNEVELAAVADQPIGSRMIRFLQFWTAKEARMKLTGEGVWLDPRDISLELEDGLPVGYSAPQIPDVRLFFPVLPNPGAVCTLVLEAR